MKIIEAIEQCTESRLRWQFLKCIHISETVGLSKNYYMNKNIFVGNKWKGSNVHESLGLYTTYEYWCWKPLAFERNVVYG